MCLRVVMCAGVAAEGSLPEREFTYYPRLTAMSTMYPDEVDAAQVGCSCTGCQPASWADVAVVPLLC